MSPIGSCFEHLEVLFGEAVDPLGHGIELSDTDHWEQAFEG